MSVRNACIGLILPTVETARRARSVAAELGMEHAVLCRVGNHMEGLELARKLEKDGVDVLVSRRSTAALIEEHLSTPNVTIGITLEDIAQAMADARRITRRRAPRIGLFAMASDQANIESFAALLHFPLNIYLVTPNEEYLEFMVQRAVADNMDVIVAGTVVTGLAQKYCCPNVVLDCGAVALRGVLLEAGRLAHTRQMEKVRSENFRIVVEKSRNGILVLDRDGNVQIANSAAGSLLGCDVVPTMSRMEDLLPELHILHGHTDIAPLREQFLTTRRGDLVVDVTPIRVGGAAEGAVISFQLAEAVSETGASAKKKLYSHRFLSRYDFSHILGQSPDLVKARQIAAEYAASDGAVLIAGETGTGKELFAHAVHAAGTRRAGPFVAINCAALPASLLESELFGYEEGAFTGAARKGKPGLFEMAHTGTIFLDEISELSRQSQMRLLRVLQERRVMRLGSTRQIPLDIRVLSATNKNLWQLVRRKRFREDLYYRLCVLPLFLPPLRQRQGDVAVLAEAYLRRLPRRGAGRKTLPKDVLRLLENHSWPGNVRELHNVLERITVHARTHAITAAEVAPLLVPELAWRAFPAGEADLRPEPADVNSEREHIVRALRACNGHRGKTAALLGMDRSTLFRKIQAYGIQSLSV